MYRGGFLNAFVTEFVPAFFGVILGIVLMLVAVVAACYSTIAPPTCRARGAKMNLEVSWGFWEGCMGNVKGQWLPWSDIVPVEKDGKIIFVPKPRPAVSLEDR